ncbi:hypothetical protein Y11_42821 [Yersinia enterocolitica subsp. palearctica Y11]|uniref:Uncharacterized protein n=1 Tax=Yersinia enterocolitica subsp. palearctica serotype O:3 (strain DSM 13030 / CIP 106945 / Y11) TaxID=930944 RepID=A0A0H3NSQ9_YERE1|nr:hypothetical protein Y11_42821 [Yersinia enterocolitica subsp. palearctica Y11]
MLSGIKKDVPLLTSWNSPVAVSFVITGLPTFAVAAAITPPDTKEEIKIDKGNKRVFNVLR